MPISGESRLMEVMELFNGINERIEAIEKQAHGTRAATDESETPSKDMLMAIMHSDGFWCDISEKLHEQIDERISERESDSETFGERVEGVIISFNESNEILNADNVAEVADEKASEWASENLGPEIDNHLEYCEYITSDTAYEIANSCIGESDSSEDFLTETESFFRAIVDGVPDCWKQAFNRINESAQAKLKSQGEVNKKEATRDNQRHRAIEVLADAAGLNFNEEFGRIKNEDEETEKARVLEVTQADSLNKLDEAKAVVKAAAEALSECDNDD